MRNLKNNSQYIAICVVTGFLYLLLFRFRSLDNNTIASWDSIFSIVNALPVYGYLVAGVIPALIVSRISPPLRFTASFLFLISFAVVSLFWKIPEYNIDASRYFTQAKHLELYGVSYFFSEWGKAITAWTDLPAVPFLYGAAFKVFGEYRTVIQIITTTFFSLTVALTYLTGRLLWDEETGFLAAALMFASPYLLIQAPIMLVDVPTMFFVSLSVFAFIKALRQGGIWMWIASPTAICLMFFSKYSAWPMFSVLVIVLLVQVKNNSASSREAIRNGMVPVLCSLVIIALVVALKYNVFMEQIKLLIGFQGPALQQWVESYLSIFFFQIHPFVTLLALYSLYAALIKKDYTFAIIAWLPALAVLFQVKRIRYLLPLFPMMTLMAAYGLRGLSDKRVARFIVYSAVFTSLAVALSAYVPYLTKQSAENLINAGRLLDSIEVKSAEIIVLPRHDEDVNPAVVVPILDLATVKPLIYHHEPQSPNPDALASRYRFSWEYKNPAYYSGEGKNLNKDIAVVVISSEPDEQLPPALAERTGAFRRCKVFGKHVDLFSFQTAVRIYW